MKGWYGDKHKHSLASRGIRTSINNNELDIVDHPYFEAFKSHIPHLNEPKYFEEWKNQKFKIVYMTVDKYEEAVRIGFNEGDNFETKNISELRERLFQKNIEHIKQDMLSGNKWNPPQLYYKVFCENRYDNKDCWGSFGQEGHHRSIASEQLGENVIPVYVIYPPEKHIDLVKKYMTSHIKGELYD